MKNIKAILTIVLISANLFAQSKYIKS